jgi:GT2 family glycosyltransferase/glycosyltransferase involved in cell wall biosynthesis
MNVLFVLYGGLDTNSAIPMALHARELARKGHRCAVAVPAGPTDSAKGLRVAHYAEALRDPAALFDDGRAADIVHAWTPREGLRRFVTAYLARNPAPLVIYLEDNEAWIARAGLGLVGMREETILQHTEEVIAQWTPEGMPHVLHHEAFVGMADAAVVIQDKLRTEVPPWVPASTVMPGVDLAAFAPRPVDSTLRARYGVAPGERVIVYPGGLNDFTRPGIEALCRAVGIVNARGTACRLLRSGPVGLDFLDRLPPEAANAVRDLGELPRAELPALLSIADVLVQPGKPDPFEDLRLPGKLPELLASGRPVLLPDSNIAPLLRDGVEAIVHRTGSPEEMAGKCLALFADASKGEAIGAGGRRFAETHFDPATQAGRLEGVYLAAREAWRPEVAKATWTADAGSLHPQALLAHRLRLLAGAGARDAAVLRQHARTLESALERVRALETGMAVRDGEIAKRDRLLALEIEARAREVAIRDGHIANLQRGEADARERAEELTHRVGELTGELAARDAHIAAITRSLSWRLTAPVRFLLAGPVALADSIRLGPRKPVELVVRPMGRDPKPVEGQPSRWLAESSDPAFAASVAPGEPLIRPGWYRARAALAASSGRLAGPRLYAPFPSGGYSEFRSVELMPEGDAYAADIYVSGKTAELRFDPSIYPCQFDFTGLRLEPIPGARRWLRTGAGLAGVVRSLPWQQLVVWAKQGTHVLFTQGPKALWDAAFWALANHARGRDIAYGDWVKAYATPSPADLAAMAAESRALARQPLVSLVTPVYNTQEAMLRAMLDSVLAQAYPRWELCIADDASKQPHVRAVLEEYRARDPRIKVAWREKNGHISAASNTALGLATGEYVALLDHDDVLPPDALYWVARELNDHPDAALLYSDEDKIDFDGRRIMPYFKCDWNYDLFLAHNLITHLGVYRRDVVAAIGGFREGLEGAQDYDLALRYIERIDHSRIRHIPRVLYHWRMLRGSTAVGAAEKDYAAERARRAVEEHLQRTGAQADVETVKSLAVQRVRYALPQTPGLASIIVPTRNGQKLVRQCVESVRSKTDYAPYEIVLVDNGSDDPAALAYFESLEREGAVRLLRDPLPFNFSRINNLAVREARGEYLVFMNNDVEVITPGWLTEMVSHAQRPEIGAVGARLWYPNDTIQHAGLVLVAGLAAHAHLGRKRGDHGYFSRASLTQSLSAVTAACLCVRRAVFDEVGGFDETLAVAFNDVDLCLRIQAAGYRNLYTPYAELYHHESASRGYEDTPEKMRRFQKEADKLRARWMPVLMNDPYYNPNLTLSGDPFTLAWPPRVEPFRATQPA